MEAADLQVRMLGGLSIRLNGREINDNDNRSRKIWLLMSYMIYCRTRPISQDELADLLWGDEERSSNPVNALKTMFHRVRSLLNQLDGAAGHNLIVRREGTYAWNQEIPFFLDTDQFEALCRAGTAQDDEDLRLETYLQALALYGGDFLPKLSSEPWVVPISAYFHNLYIRTVQETLPLLEGRGRLREAVDLCRRSVEVEPYNELLYQHLMQNLLTLGEQQAVISAYEEMSQLLFDSFGIMPSDETRAIYREAMRTVNDKAVSIITLREQLREPDGVSGALFCDYDFFKVLYHAEARAVARSGDAVHIGFPTTPRITYGFGGFVTYKNLEFSFSFQGSGRRGFFIDPVSISPFVSGRQLLKAIAEDHWTPENMEPRPFWPRLSVNGIDAHNREEYYDNSDYGEGNTYYSTYFMRECRFLRCTGLELAYNLPDTWKRALKMQNVKFFFRANNPFIISNFDLWDVELGGSGFNYPIQRTYAVGLNFSF